MAVNLRLNTTVAWPIILLITFLLGRLSGTWLSTKRPFRWVALISVLPAVVSLALHPAAVAFSDKHGSVPPHALTDRVPRMVVGTLLIFCALALGNLSRRRSRPIRHG